MKGLRLAAAAYRLARPKVQILAIVGDALKFPARSMCWRGASLARVDETNRSFGKLNDYSMP
jgi:hypothetical protein